MIIHYTRDLRTHDNPATISAAPNSRHVYVVDPTLGGAQKWWLHHSLKSFGAALARNGACLEILERLPDGPCFRNRSFDNPIGYDNGYLFTGTGCGTTIAHNNTTYGRVAMPNRRAILPARLWGPPVEWDASIVDRFFPLPTKPNWAGGFDIWNPGEEGALKRLLEWDAEITPEHYGQFRGYPSDAVTSRMSPHIHFGEISPLQIAAVLHHAHPMINELQWREYKHDSYARLPEYRDIEYRGYCRGYKWGNDIALFDAWCKGETGYRVVDAGMQELWATGYMNNRVRMVVSSFLVKLLDIDWRWGQAWFEDTLCDADHAINSQSWQDTMGASHDSKPYPIILNPLLQYEKFGMKAYCDKWAPGYVKPIIDYAVARKHAEDKWTRHKITLA